MEKIIPTHKEIRKQDVEQLIQVSGDSLKRFIEFEQEFFIFNNHIDYYQYKKNLLSLMTEIKAPQDWIDYVELKKRSIGVYPGSFNPFHVGHLSILEKAEKIFDKVIVARGINPEKSNEFCDLPESIKNRQIETYPDLLTDFLESLKYEATVIKGLRNATDLQYEIGQLSFMKTFKPDIKLISIFCNSEFEHVSSRAIKILDKYGKGDLYRVF